MFTKLFNWGSKLLVSTPDTPDTPNIPAEIIPPHLKSSDIKSLALLNAVDTLVSPLGFECVFHLLSQVCPNELAGSHVENQFNGKYNPLEIAASIMAQTGVVFESIDVIAHTPAMNMTLQIAEKELSHLEHIINNPETSSKFIRELIKQKTRNLIDMQLDMSQYQLFIMNIIYFLGKWEFKFEVESNVIRPWHIQKFGVEYMRKSAMYIPYVRTSNAEIIELKYQNKDFSFGIVLPTDSIDTILANKSQLMESILADKEATLVHVTIPIFKLQCCNESAVIKEVFGLCGSCDYQQNTVIKVDTNGTEAAAVTVACIPQSMGMYKTEPINFFANRPFVYYIMHKSTASILFVGRLDNPNN
jgi:serine protease inhibitor